MPSDVWPGRQRVRTVKLKSQGGRDFEAGLAKAGKTSSSQLPRSLFTINWPVRTI
jgi:hypothetical protein